MYVAAAGLALIAALQLRRVESHTQRVEARVAYVNRYDRPTVQSAIQLKPQLPDTHQFRRAAIGCICFVLIDSEERRHDARTTSTPS